MPSSAVHEHLGPSAWPVPRQVLDLLQSPACLLDEYADALYLNPAWAAFAGIHDPCDRPAPWLRLLHPAHRNEALSMLHAAKGSRIAPFECRLLGADAEVRWFLLDLHLAQAGPDAPGYWICTATDIHALKSREALLEQRESMKTDMLDVSMDCIKLIALDGNLIHMNKAGCLALGVPEDSRFGFPWLPLLPEDVRAAGATALQAAGMGLPGRFNGRSVSETHGERLWDNLLTPVIDSEGRPTAILCVSRDVTAERKALDSLKENEERLAIAARVGGLGIWDYDIRQDRLHCDENWYRIMGRNSGNPVRTISDFKPFIHPDDVEQATEVANTAAELIESERDYSLVFRIVRPNGDIRWLKSLAYLQHQDGVPMRAVGFVADVTDAWRGELALRDANRTLEQEMSSLARKLLEDPLTGISNRRHFDGELASMRVRAGECGEPFCIGMIDVDHFKQFNDRYGHVEGDAALRRIATALQSATRQSDLVARYGGEEFAFLLSGTADPVPVVERFVSAVAGLSITHEDLPWGRLSISCGVVVSRSSALPAERLIAASDEALYEAKSGGRNRYVVRHLDDSPAI